MTLFGLVLGGALLLASCGSAPKPAPSTYGPDTVVTDTQQSPREAVDQEDPAETARVTGEPPRIPHPADPAELAEADSVPPVDRLPGPETLVGLSVDDVLALMGDPDFRRTDPPAELWQYAGPGCILDLFLYDKAGEGTPRVIHLDSRGRTVARVPARDCYLGLLQSRHTAATGG